MKFPEHYTLAEKNKLLDHLLTFVSENKQQKFREIIQSRTRHITIVLEDIFQPHNASAVLRSCDCFGIQDIHIIENKNSYEVNPDVALGSAKWLNLIKYNKTVQNTTECLNGLKEKGYRIVATTPHKDDFTPENFPLDNKFALVFGTELEGLTDDALNLADMYIRIPMIGFTESLNISVSAAILLHTMTGRLFSSGIHWKLSDEEMTETLLTWASSVVKKPDLLIRDFVANQ
ncbi:MAG: RNA methyltransferase [Bacteroidales bacterium]|nr:RNA methyltransferase [Bacteroidota bacterium]MBL6949468.1 RNA methyltransferase [Bacteroidales bacterium]